MSKPSVKKVKFSAAEMAYDLPDELDFSKLEHIGRGWEAMERHAAWRRTSVQLEPDVAAAFKDSAAVNQALRLIIEARRIMEATPEREPGKRRRDSVRARVGKPKVRR